MGKTPHLTRTVYGIVFTVAALLVGFGPCAMSPAQICSKRLPELRREIQTAQLQLNPLLKVDRTLASVSAGGPASRGIDSKSGNPWLPWSVDHLEEAQHYLDLSYDHPKLRQIRPDLSTLANDWVLFYGYAKSQKYLEMRNTLSEIDSRHEEIQAALCGASQ